MGGRAGKEDKRSGLGEGVVDPATGLRSWPASPEVQRAARKDYDAKAKSEAQARLAKPAAEKAAAQPATRNTDIASGVTKLLKPRANIERGIEDATK